MSLSIFVKLFNVLLLKNSVVTQVIKENEEIFEFEKFS